MVPGTDIHSVSAWNSSELVRISTVRGRCNTKMVDAGTKKALAAIPLLKTKAGPRDGDLWVQRLKEEYQSLIKVNM